MTSPVAAPATATRWVRWFDDVGIDDVASVGGKNASLGELRRALGGVGVPVPDGFAITAGGFWHTLDATGLRPVVASTLAAIVPGDVESLHVASRTVRDRVLGAALPDDLEAEIVASYRELGRRLGIVDPPVAVRSSATAEDLPGASFAGAHSTFLDIRGVPELLDAVRRCFASLYTPRAIGYRTDLGFEQTSVALSVGVQHMVDAANGVAGVMFTLDTETGFRDVVQIDAIWGLGENIVGGRVGPDEWYVHKPTLAAGFRPVLRRKLGTKEQRLVYDAAGGKHRNVAVPPPERARFCLTDDEVLQLARWAVAIEQHYSAHHGRPTPMDIEFAKDGPDGGLYVVQARPETVHAGVTTATISQYTLDDRPDAPGAVLVDGLAVGEKIATGTTRVVADPRSIGQLQPGEVLVTSVTDPDWEPIMKSAAAIVTERGGRTSHAAIVARELGIPAIVGATGAMALLRDPRPVTVCCAEGEIGHVYDGTLPFRVDELDPAALPPTRTKIMVNVGDPERAFKTALLPNDGVGLARMEFVFASWVKVHPLALTRYDTLDAATRRAVDTVIAGAESPTAYFVDTLAQGIATLAAAFWPKPVILRLSDFKTNEYAHLLGGADFEPVEANPMLGWRGASRYYHPGYREGFLLEAAAVRKVRDEMGLRNLALMVPFCRTPAEGRRVLDTLAEAGLRRGEDGLAVYVMAEIPSNVILADRFAELFDGFSIGSNDLTQLVLGIDRDSATVAPLFDERDEAVRRLCSQLIEVAHAHGRTVGICGQAPSDYPEFAAFLVEAGIDSVSLNPDAVVRTKRRIAETEARLAVGADGIVG